MMMRCWSESKSKRIYIVILHGIAVPDGFNTLDYGASLDLVSSIRLVENSNKQNQNNNSLLSLTLYASLFGQ